MVARLIEIPQERLEQSGRVKHHSMDEFLDLSFEQLFQEPVYLEEDEEEPEGIAQGGEGLPISEEVFLEIEFESLFDVPVRIAKFDEGEQDKQKAEGEVQSSGSSFNLLKVLSDQKRNSDEFQEVLSEEQQIDVHSEVTITVEEDLPPPTPLPINKAPTAPPVFSFSVQEETGVTPVFKGNLFDPSDNFFGSIPSGGDGGAIINIFLRPGGGQTKTEFIGSQKILITTLDGNTFEYYPQTEAGNQAGDYIYTLLSPIQHNGLNPSNLPITKDDINLLPISKGMEPSSQTVLQEAMPGVPTVQSIVETLFTELGGVQPNGKLITGNPFKSFGDGVFPDYHDLPNEEDDHNPFVDKITAAVWNTENPGVNDDLDVSNTYFDVFVYNVIDSVDGDSVRGYFVFKVVDDQPVLMDDNNFVNETLLFKNGTESTTGNLLTNDDKGFDDGQIISLSVGGVEVTDGSILDLNPAANLIKVATFFGSAEVNTLTGAYVYKLLDVTDSDRDGGIDSDDDAPDSVDDTIVYKFRDTDGDTDTATLSIEIDLNQAPVAVDDPVIGQEGLYATQEKMDLVINSIINGVLGDNPDTGGNDTDPDFPDTFGSTATGTLNGMDIEQVVAVEGSSSHVGNKVALTTLIATGDIVQPLVQVNSDGTFSLDLKNAGNLIDIQYDDGVTAFSTEDQFARLAFGEMATVSLNYRVGDAEFLVNGNPLVSDTGTVTLTIHGVDDAPQVDSDVGSVSEDGVFIDTGDLNPVEIDASDANTLTLSFNPSVGIADTDLGTKMISGKYGTVTFDRDGDWSYSLDNTSAVVQSLSAGQMEVDEFDVAYSDNSPGDTATGTLTITITGANDLPEISSDTGSVGEDATTTATGDVMPVDIDTNDTNTLTVSFGTNTVSLTDTATGTVSLDGQYGSLEIDADGDWTYTLDNTSTAVQSLAAADVVMDDFGVSYNDASSTATATINISVAGANDLPEVSSDTGSVGEDATTTATGDVMPVDIDTNDINTLTVSFGTNTVSLTDTATGTVSLDGQYGSLEIDADGDWTYTLDNTSTAVQSLAAADVVMDDFGVSYNDASSTATATISISVAGANDLPEVSSDTGSVGEDATATATGDVMPVDIDTNDTNTLTVSFGTNTVSLTDTATGTVSLDGQYGSLEIDAEGDWTYTLDNTSTAVQSLAAADVVMDDFGVSYNDASSTATATINISVAGANDLPGVSSDTGSVGEDATTTATGDVMPVDIDTNDINTLTVSFGTNTVSLTDTATGTVSLDGQYGSLEIDADGDWTYTLDNTSTAVQSLAAADVVMDDFGVSYNDASSTATATISISVAGANDLPTVVNDDDTTSIGLLSTDEDTFFSIASSVLLSNDLDVDNDTLVVTSLTDGTSSISLLNETIDLISGGVIKITGLDGSGNITKINFDPDGDFESLDAGVDGTATFGYSLSDGNTGTGSANVAITVEGVTDVMPVIFDLNYDGQIQLISTEESELQFDYNDQLINLGWVGPEDGILVYDQDGNEAFSGLHEIELASYHEEASTDLEGLRLAFDSNLDNIFDSLDSLWNQFGIWQDKNSNGVSEQGEYMSLVDSNIESILLLSDPLKIENEGNIIYGYSEYSLDSGGSFLIADVSLRGRALLEDDVLADMDRADYPLEELLAITSEATYFEPSTDEASYFELSPGFSESNQTVEQVVQQAQQGQSDLS